MGILKEFLQYHDQETDMELWSWKWRIIGAVAAGASMTIQTLYVFFGWFH